MKSIIHRLTLASLFAIAGSVSVVAQDEPAAEPAQSPPPAESPPPAVESPPPAAAESPPPAPSPAVEQPAPVVESPAPQAAEAAPTAAPVPSEPAEVSRPGRPAESPSAEGAQRGERPARDDSVPDAGRGGNRESSSPEQTSPEQGDVAQSGRSGRGPDRPSSGGPSQRDDGRRDSGQRDNGQRDNGQRDNGQRPQLGISIGPGGVQLFRGNPGVGPGYSHPSRNNNNYGWDRGRNSGYGYSPSWYQGRGWGIAIDTRPQVVVPSGPVIVTQPQSIQPAAPLPPEEPPIPTDEQLAGMPGVELQGLLFFAVDRLDEQLDGLSTGSGWKAFLKTDELRRAIPPPTLAPPPPESGEGPSTTAESLMPEPARRQLADILKTYEKVQQNSEYRQISKLWGFQTTRLVLRELLVPPIQRLRRQLSLSSEFLEQELEQFETSSSWAKHLKLDEAKRIAAVRTEEISATDLKSLQAIVSVFDSVAAEPSYRMISDLLGFRLAQYGARSYLAQLKVPAPPAPGP